MYYISKIRRGGVKKRYDRSNRKDMARTRKNQTIVYGRLEKRFWKKLFI